MSVQSTKNSNMLRPRTLPSNNQPTPKPKRSSVRNIACILSSFCEKEVGENYLRNCVKTITPSITKTIDAVMCH